ncbi:hypothetical protein F5X68DRAFT_227625 [Plectosphaerella plurivora]|uniref:Uncharacterized protein n=1 Tax=Plectosphaerella plurivora TaxID=936078 RepID=A0A9P9AF16_9PEZI|nr:hypothetical protein F5X68DRAFT_227625 [Plectosphaerella plurivora]
MSKNLVPRLVAFLRFYNIPFGYTVFDKMKFTIVVFGLFAAFAAAAPAPQPKGAKLETRQNCGPCISGTRTCYSGGFPHMVRC